MSEWFSLEDRNYYNDHRVRGGRDRWWIDINERKMMVRHKYDTEDDLQVWYKFKYETCDTCDGKGNHVNPSVDCNGLTYEDLYDDGYAEDYFGGVYDVQCYKCHGNRVMPVKFGKPIHIEPKEDDDDE
jgi:hypothetical protein